MPTNSNEYDRQYYSQNRDKLVKNQNEKNKAMRDRLRNAIGKLKHQRGCEARGCTIDHPDQLEFHHRDPKKKLFDISTGISQCLSKDRLLQEISKCDVLCKLHHAEVTAGNRVNTKTCTCDPTHYHSPSGCLEMTGEGPLDFCKCMWDGC